MIHLNHITKRFGRIPAVKDLSFRIGTGRIAAFLGPNGAGKTTTMRMLTGYLKPCQGQIELGDVDISSHPLKARKKVGYLPETTPLYADQLVVDVLLFFARMRGMSRVQAGTRIDEIAEDCGLKHVLHRPIRTLSKGYRQRVGLAQALIHDPEILILDEPTTGLDPNQISEILTLIQNMGKDKTVLLSTHILNHVPIICTDVLILNRGELVFQGTPAQLLKQDDAPSCIILETDASLADLQQALAGLDTIEAIKPCASRSRAFTLTGSLPEATRQHIVTTLLQKKLTFSALIPQEPGIEAVFAKLTRTREPNHRGNP